MNVGGRCACGGVTFEVRGEPIAQFYCHCRSCQLAHAAPVAAIAMFPEASVTYAGETRRVRVTDREDAAWRVICERCGTKVINEPGMSIRAILPVLCETRDWFAPQMHVGWEDHSLEMRDDLPKFLDYPAELGGTGKMA